MSGGRPRRLPGQGHTHPEPPRPASREGRGSGGRLSRADLQDLRAAERDVGVEGELLVRREPQPGVTAGKFGEGDLVSICDEEKNEFARGLTKVDCIQMKSASGVVIHRDDMVIL